MRHLESSCFIDDDPALADFLKKRPTGGSTRMPVYNINERSLSIRASPLKQSRQGVFTSRKTSEDRWYRIRSTSRRSTRSGDSSGANQVQLKKQILEVTDRQPALKKLAHERMKLLNQPARYLSPKARQNPLQSTVKFSLLTLQPKRMELSASRNSRHGSSRDKLKTRMMALMVDNPFKPTFGYSQYI